MEMSNVPNHIPNKPCDPISFYPCTPVSLFMIIRLLTTIASVTICCSALAESEPLNRTFFDVTSKVIDQNPPGLGSVFDDAFVDLNDDNLLDIVLNHHHQSKPSPIWLGTPKFKFKYC
jgi:hypothetical protein